MIRSRFPFEGPSRQHVNTLGLRKGATRTRSWPHEARAFLVPDRPKSPFLTLRDQTIRRTSSAISSGVGSRGLGGRWALFMVSLTMVGM